MKHAKDYIVFPLDVPSVKTAQHYVELLSESVGMFKVGLELFIRSGLGIIDFIKASGTAEVFLDLKLHDIPATVFRAMESIADLGVAFATVHCGETPRMLEAAVEGAKGRVGILGVTVLTSVASEDIKASGFRDMFYDDMGERFGRDFIAVTPGIRPEWDVTGKHDQRRITTPGRAVSDGSDYLVIGRPIRDATDPKAAAVRIAHEIETVI
ncbi:MAG: orotidine 5'-phosphate decarboxylase [Deltaproteobacteria bacterium]|nr:orotidine 5'-phosphate decarboxylase [Deltaproteobacteria bacterium]